MPCTQWLLFKCSVHSSSGYFSFRPYFQGDCIPYSDKRQPRSFWSQEIFWESFSSEWFPVSCPVLLQQRRNVMTSKLMHSSVSGWRQQHFCQCSFGALFSLSFLTFFWDASNRNHDLRSICWKLITPDTLERWILLFMPQDPPSVKLEQFPMCK